MRNASAIRTFFCRPFESKIDTIESPYIARRNNMIDIIQLNSLPLNREGSFSR